MGCAKWVTGSFRLRKYDGNRAGSDMAMRTRDAVFLGAVGGMGLLWGARAWRRRSRRIELTDRVVVITGATSGHGLLLAREAAGRGARLVIAARSADDLAAAEEDLLQAGARSVLAVPTDVTDEGQVRALIETAASRFGRIDVLINNAAVIQVGPLEAMTLHDFQEAMATNYWASVHAVLAVLPVMRRQGFGRIGNVVSFGGKVAVPHLLPYVTSKFALTGLTEGLRAELAKDNILVTGVYPPTMRTGAHVHAWVKGDHKAEHAWFSLGDTLPLLSVSASRVARRFLQAVCDGEAEVVVGWPTYLAVVLQGLLPSEMGEFLGLVNRLLPKAEGGPNQAIQGGEVRGAIADLVNRAIPEGTRPRVV